MRTQLSKALTIVLTVIISGPLIAEDWSTDEFGRNWLGNRHVQQVFGTDDWLPSPPSGDLYCSEGVLDMTNPLLPLCPPGTTLEVRNATAFSRMHANDPRVAGQLTFVFSGSFDSASFSGPAWGTWKLESDGCDGTWEGTFAGQRSFVPGQANPLDPFFPPGFGGVWISNLDLRGKSTGDCGGLRMKGVEIITTLTPLPLAYEMLLPCDQIGCLPEGVTAGRIFRRWR